MPELPEVEILVRHLRPALHSRVIRDLKVYRPKVVRPETPDALRAVLQGKVFREVRRRAKYLIFDLETPTRGKDSLLGVTLIGHLGMTGRMFVQSKGQPLPKHTAVTLDLGDEVFVFEDTRYFGRLNLDAAALSQLGPEPLDDTFTPDALRAGLGTSRQAIKIKLLDQTVVAGVGNIYASEALFRAGINPRRGAQRLKPADLTRLVASIREVLLEAIQFGSTIPLEFSSTGRKDGLFYYGQSAGGGEFYVERLRVYDRADQPCLQCGSPIQRLVQAARSTFWCRHCQTA